MRYNYGEKQMQIDDILYMKTYKYIKLKKISFNQFAEEVGSDPYILRKAFDRKIKMCIFESLYQKINSVVS